MGALPPTTVLPPLLFDSLQERLNRARRHENWREGGPFIRPAAPLRAARTKGGGMRPPYVARWRNALRDAELDATAKLAGFALATFMNADGICWPGKPRLAGACSRSKRAVDGAIDRLERAGFLTIERTAGGNPKAQTNRYQATLPAVQIVQGSGVQEMQGSKRSAVQIRTLSRATDDTSPATVAPEVVKDDEQAPLNAGASLEGAPASATFNPEEVARKAAEL